MISGACSRVTGLPWGFIHFGKPLLALRKFPLNHVPFSGGANRDDFDRVFSLVVLNSTSIEMGR